MSTPLLPSRADWETRHVAARLDAEPSSFLKRHIQRLPRGRALDLACGSGRNTRVLLESGFDVDAIDIAHSALRKVAALQNGSSLVCPVQSDLEGFSLPRARYSLVLCVRYLQRSLWPAMREATIPGGFVLIETFLSPQRYFGHPRNPDFLLLPGELVDAFRCFEVEEYEEGLVQCEGGQAFLARLLARRPLGWKPD